MRSCDLSVNLPILEECLTATSVYPLNWEQPAKHRAWSQDRIHSIRRLPPLGGRRGRAPHGVGNCLAAFGGRGELSYIILSYAICSIEWHRLEWSGPHSESSTISLNCSHNQLG